MEGKFRKLLGQTLCRVRINLIRFVSDSEYRGALSEAVLRLQEQGKLSVNKIKWWKEKRGGGACDVSEGIE